MLKLTHVALAATFAVALSGAAPARAQQQYGERVLSFHADVTVNQDATLDVVETIRVAAGGQVIDHGIYRDFPTRQRGLVNHLFPFEVRSVTRDGQPEPYTVGRGGDAARVQVGDADTHLSIGVHTFVLTYRAERQLRYFGDHDELNWNVTGTDWKLAIDEASAEVHLPPDAAARMRDLGGYTGPAGSTDAQLRAERRGDVAVFATTRPLAAQEGLTIVVRWPQGLVRRPSANDVVADVARDNGLLGLAAVGALALALYVWSMGRRRRSREQQARSSLTLVTDPPEGLSAGALHYVTKMDSDDSTFTAGLVGLADKGQLEIARGDDGTYTLRSLAGPLPASTPEEQALLSALFPDRDRTLTLTSDNARTISRARSAFFEAIRAAHGNRYFVRRGGDAKGGIVLALLSAAALAASGPGQARLGCALLTVWVAFWTFGVYALGKAAVDAWRKAARSGYPPTRVIGSVFTTVFATTFAAAEVGVLVAYGAMASPLAAALFAAVLLLAARLVGWLTAPTALGIRVRAAADAYREYLLAARPSQWSATRPPPLAYALALNIAPAWITSLVEAGGITAPPFRPLWWRGDNWDQQSFRDFGDALPSAVSTATSTTSSESDGGGSSGGGGGGGGGGGW